MLHHRLRVWFLTIRNVNVPSSWQRYYARTIHHTVGNVDSTCSHRHSRRTVPSAQSPLPTDRNSCEYPGLCSRLPKSPGTNDVGRVRRRWGPTREHPWGDELGVVVGNSDGESLGFMVGDELELGTSLGGTDGLVDGTIEGTIEGTVEGTIEEIRPALPKTD